MDTQGRYNTMCMKDFHDWESEVYYRLQDNIDDIPEHVKDEIKDRLFANESLFADQPLISREWTKTSFRAGWYQGMNRGMRYSDRTIDILLTSLKVCFAIAITLLVVLITCVCALL